MLAYAALRNALPSRSFATLCELSRAVPLLAFAPPCDATPLQFDDPRCFATPLLRPAHRRHANPPRTVRCMAFPLPGPSMLCPTFAAHCIAVPLSHIAFLRATFLSLCRAMPNVSQQFPCCARLCAAFPLLRLAPLIPSFVAPGIATPLLHMLGTDLPLLCASRQHGSMPHLRGYVSSSQVNRPFPLFRHWPMPEYFP